MSRIPLILLTLPLLAPAQNLQKELAQIAAASQGKVNVACSLPGVKLDCNVNPDFHAPMQSVFKLPLALAILHEVELGKFRLDQNIRFEKGDLFTVKTYSPLQDKYPNADVDVPLREILRLTVSSSDNTGSEILLRLLGGPAKLQAYMDSLGIKGFHFQDSEKALHNVDKLQYRNWWTPAATVQLMRLLADNPPFNAEHTAFIRKMMLETETGPKRLKGELPPGTLVYHKTGSSGVRSGLAAATNDLGYITMPNNKQLAIAVYVTDSRGSQELREATIAKVAKAIYLAALAQSH
jgi:beta-lactamase class A